MVQSWQRKTKQKVSQKFLHGSGISFPTLTADNAVVEPLTIEINAAGHDIHRMYIDGGASAAIREEKAKLQMKGYYDAKVRGVSFRPGDFVYRANDASHAEDTGKLGPKWEGPYEVTEALGKGAYKLRDMDGRELPRTWNIYNLKKCYL
ncbi:hypothetical protein Tco_0517457 [Tanacetum coccineum]